MVVNAPTQVSGSSFDQIYIFGELYHQVKVNTLIKNVYFNNHEAVKVIMKAFQKE